MITDNEEKIMASPITINVVNTIEGFQNLSQDWSYLLHQSKSENPFISHEWLFSWWKGYGADKKLLILKLTQNEKIVCIAPLMEYQTSLAKLPIKAIGFIGNHWMGGDFIFGNQANQEQCVKKISEYLVKIRKPIIFSYFRKNTDTKDLLIQELNKMGSQYTLNSRAVPIIQKQGTWEDYLKARGRKFRYEFKYALKLAEKAGKFEFLSLNEFEIEPTLEIIRGIALNNWKGKEGVAIIIEPGGRDFYHEIFKNWVPQKQISIAFLKINNEFIAYLIGFKIKENYYAFDIAFNGKYKKMTPGVLLFTMQIEKLFKEGFSLFDFNYEAGYISRWTEKTVDVYDLIVYPHGFSGVMLKWGNQFKKIYKQSIRKEQIND